MHWAFQPLRRPAVPKSDMPGLRNPIDYFIAAALDAKKNDQLTLRPEADRATLVRRVAFDLTGLPPTIEEMDDFVSSKAADAYEKMLDHFLASEAYGQRWGKFWLDAAGYTDSNGYFSADSDRPLAYKYRDYVVRSFNADKPFDRFVREQLAGDELSGFNPDGDVSAEMAEMLAATHFLRNAPDGSGESDGNPDEVRIDRYTVIEGNLQTTMNTLLGVTIQCARCHAHKFEPIAHEEYYRLQAILFPAYTPDKWLKPNDRFAEIGTRAQREESRLRLKQFQERIKKLEADLNAVAKNYRAMAAEKKLAGLDAKIREAIVEALRTSEDKRTKEQIALLKQHVEPLKLTDEALAKEFPEFAAKRDGIRKQIGVANNERPLALERVSVLTDSPSKPPATPLLLRGQHSQPGAAVEPGVPAAFTGPANVFRISTPASGHGSGRRSALAQWITSPANPLFARVYVNRVWQHHFGKGLVATPDNFGLSGARPSHPELLDLLALEFIEGGWSIKKLHKLILSSAAYRQSSQAPESLLRTTQVIDPDNRLLWRFPLRRLDAEALRDGMLAVSGELDRRLAGPYVPTIRSDEGNVVVDEKNPGARRRSIYLQQRRTQVATFLELFDAPAITNASCSVRNSSAVPLQALTLLNSDFARLRARSFANRLARDAGTDANARMLLAFRLSLGRAPSEAEATAARRFLETQIKDYAVQKDAEARAWADLCQMLLASNAFLYVE